MTHHGDLHDLQDCVEQLRTALEANGITLPSLGVETAGR